MLYQIIDENTLRSLAELNILPNGAPCSNVVAWFEENSEAQKEYGWYALDDSAVQPEVGTFRKRYDLVDSVIVMSWEEYVPESVVFEISKLFLSRNMRALGCEEALYALLASSQDMTRDWNNARILYSNNPMVVGACQQLVSLGVLTQEQATQLLIDSRDV